MPVQSKEINLSPKMSELDINNLKKGQKKITNILKLINEFSTKNNITYLITDSTLVGSHKYNGWIPWDNEATILILEQDFNKFITTAKENLPKELWLQHKDADPAYKCNYTARIKDLNSCYNSIDNNNLHDGLHVNINTFSIVDDNIKIDNSTTIYKYSDLMPLKLGKFEDLELSIPNKPDEVIKLHKLNNEIPLMDRLPKTTIMPDNTCEFHKNQYASLY